METALLSYFVLDTRLHSTCDFNGRVLENGLGIYEVLRVEAGVPLFLQEHIDRFFSSAGLENISPDISRNFIRKAIRLLIAENRMQQGNVKFLYHRNDKGEHHFMAWAMPFFYPAPQHYREGVKVVSMTGERHNPNAKKALYSLRQKADELIRGKKAWEAVYVNRHGFITEGSRSNVFFVRDTRLETPELSLVLPGITRAKVILLAAERDIPVIEKQISLSGLPGYDASFLTGTSPKLLPVAEFDGHTFNTNNEVMRRLMQAYDDLVAVEVRTFHW